ncbi:MAG: hypothetical protein WC717_00010 [Candidatus Micrarchaeia archaeon]
MEGENRIYTVLSLSGGLFCLAASLFFGSAPAAAAGALFFFLSLLLWKYGYALYPYFASGARIVEAGRNFEIPPSQDVVVGNEGGSFLATSFLFARLYESASEGGAEQAGKMFEKAISSSGFPFKVCCLVCPLQLRAELDEMREKRSLAESLRGKLQRGKGSEPERARLEREIAMWGRQIERLSAGEKPLEVVFYLSTTASGRTKDEAVARSRSQSEELAVVAGSALSCEITPVKGEDMKRLFW